MNDTPNPPPGGLPPRPRLPPILGPSRLVRRLRWIGLGLFAFGLVVALVAGQTTTNETLRLAGPVIGLVGVAVFFAAAVIRAFQWRREEE